MIASEVEAKFKKTSQKFLEIREVMKKSIGMLEEKIFRLQPATD
jgi:hypothetical protein